MWRPLIVLFLTMSVALYLLSFPYAEALHGQGSSFYRRRRHKVRSYTRFVENPSRSEPKMGHGQNCEDFIPPARCKGND
ncbi:hypothetical protein P5673_013214 [Acropora cervicornis]|uniref:Uncharacterized protein n=1 Tax=Acropora cervicornis TaxID=6130 RepID=A0AAD9QM67_ACRCE|nr:hypothetical protein P5673_013214 [Acropora cervicornis]